MQSTHEADLDIPNLPGAARHVHLVPALKSMSLISIGQLCNAGCNVTFDATIIQVHYNDQPILTGTRWPDTKLWHLDLAQSPSPAYLPQVLPFDCIKPMELLDPPHLPNWSLSPMLSCSLRHSPLSMPHYPKVTSPTSLASLPIPYESICHDPSP
jgi:hypothetical protein